MSLPSITYIISNQAGSGFAIHKVMTTHPTPLIEMMCTKPTLFTMHILHPNDTVQPTGKTLAERFHEELGKSNFETVLELGRAFPDFLKSGYAYVPTIKRLLSAYLFKNAYIYAGPTYAFREFSIEDLPQDYEQIKFSVADAHAAYEQCELEYNLKMEKHTDLYRYNYQIASSLKQTPAELSCHRTQKKLKELQTMLAQAGSVEKIELEYEIEKQKQRVVKSQDSFDDMNTLSPKMKLFLLQKRKDNLHKNYKEGEQQFRLEFARKEKQIIAKFKKILTS